MGEAFDDAWARVAWMFGTAEIEAARVRLAAAMLMGLDAQPSNFTSRTRPSTRLVDRRNDFDKLRDHLEDRAERMSPPRSCMALITVPQLPDFQRSRWLHDHGLRHKLYIHNL